MNLLALILVLHAGFAHCYYIVLNPNVRTCFFENMDPGDKMVVNYEVDPGTSAYGTDFEVFDAFEREVFASRGEKFGTYHIKALMSGRQHYCFTSPVTTTLNFKLVDVQHKNTTDSEDLQNKLSDGLRQLVMRLKLIRDEQEYLVMGEELHRVIASSTCSRVLWWSIFQYIVLMGVCYWQVYYLKRFFEVRKTV